MSLCKSSGSWVIAYFSKALCAHTRHPARAHGAARHRAPPPPSQRSHTSTRHMCTRYHSEINHAPQAARAPPPYYTSSHAPPHVCALFIIPLGTSRRMMVAQERARTRHPPARHNKQNDTPSLLRATLSLLLLLACDGRTQGRERAHARRPRSSPPGRLPACLPALPAASSSSPARSPPPQRDVEESFRRRGSSRSLASISAYFWSDSSV
jgi:hypothetical protein